MNKWNYGDAFKDYPIAHGTAVFEDGSRLKTHDIFHPLPAWMGKAEMIFTDSPWNQGNMTSFYTKADMMNLKKYEDFYRRLFECVGEISPEVCYLEIGKQFLPDFVMEMRKIFKHVTFYNSSYYHKQTNICYIVRGSKTKGRALHLDYIDEEDLIYKVIEEEPCQSVADLCMGQGLVSDAAFKCGKRFYGTELNHKRLSVTLKRLSQAGAKYEIEVE